MNVLVVVDMQNDFINGSLGTKEAEIILPKVVDRVKTAISLNEFIIYTQDTHYQDYYDTQEGKMLPIPHCQFLTRGWQIHEDLNKILQFAPYIQNIQKTTFGTNLIKKLLEYSAKPIEKIELCGLCTDICVITNALILKTAFPEVEIVIDESLCAGVTPEKHQAALEVMRSCQINVINREEMRENE